MKLSAKFRSVVVGSCFSAVLLCSGCSKEEAAEKMNEAEASAKQASQTISDGVGNAVDKGEAMAADLSEKAQAYLSPLKDKLGNLEDLKEKPEELKQATADLIESIENKAEGMKLPESVSNALATIKEKLVALKEYLEGEVEQAKIDERVQEIVDSVKSGLGISK